MKTKVISIINMVLCVLTIACLFLPFLKLNLEAITGEISSYFGDADIWVEGKGFTMIEVVKNVLDYKEELGSKYIMFLLCLIIPFLIPVTVFILSFIQKRAVYIVNAIMAALYAAAEVIIHIVVVPKQIETIIKDVIDGSVAGNFLSLFHADNLTNGLAEEVGKAYKSSLNFGFYVPIGIMAVVLILSVVAFFLFQAAPAYNMAQGAGYQNRNAAPQKMMRAPTITVVSGVYQGAVFPLQQGETIIIGRDATQCHVIIEAEQISRRHCGISFDPITGQYRITDYSSNGTYINHDKRAMKNQVQFVPRGSIISLGDDLNTLRVD